MFIDVVPVEYDASKFGFPLPVFSSYAAWWREGFLVHSMVFVWVGALLDIIFYAIILWAGFQIAKVISEARVVR